MRHGLLLLVLVWSAVALPALPAATAVTLRAPLTTPVPLVRPATPLGDTIEVDLTVPANAPDDLGIGAYVSDRHGRWFQVCRPGRLEPGRQTLRFAIDETAPLVSAPLVAPWNAGSRATLGRAGIFFWSASASRITIAIERLAVIATSTGTPPRDAVVLDDVQLPTRASTGLRWELSLLPRPFPANPYDAAQFTLDADIVQPDGTRVSIPGFYGEPMRRSDRGDRDAVQPAGLGRFALRFRPRQPGVHHITVRGVWRDTDGQQRTATSVLPPVIVDGAAWDDYVRVDRDDPRFFSVAGKFLWPLGPNLRSVWDLRCQERLQTKLTPHRGTFAYDAYLARLAAAGGNATEIWLSSWNLALEWRADWPGYGGVGRFNQENAWRIDYLLDLSARLGIRVNLVINNHGQASDSTDREWTNNPYNRDRGGRLGAASEIFTDAWALAGQDNVRRYLVARYADAPAILGWKLWSEVNLTGGDRDAVRAWHVRAAALWHALDVYDHPVTTHWSGDFRTPDPDLAKHPGLDYLCIDAYHGAMDEGGWLLAELLYQGMTSSNHGIGRFGKPVLVTEFGGNWDAAPPPQLDAEHRSGPWAALVSGYAGAPMLWWFEWIDQGDRWDPYRALSRFLAGEDVRSPQARSIALEITSGERLWARAWSRPGRMLGYLLDDRWGAKGATTPLQSDVHIEIGSQVAAGPLVVEWWNADDGQLLEHNESVHAGGPLVLTAPDFRHHLAFKLWRTGMPTNAAPTPAVVTPAPVESPASGR